MRIFNTYDPCMHPEDGRIVSNFIIQASRNEPIIVYGDGTPMRSFCYNDDLISGMLLLMNQESQIGLINIGQPGVLLF